jgi:predicted dehydrogenase
LTALRFALIGAGRWGQVYIRTILAMHDRATLSCVCTTRSEIASTLPSSVRFVSAWREALAAGCDAVIIATPPSTHAEILEACVAARLPCIVEKPLCLDIQTAMRLQKSIAKSGIPVLVNHTQLFHPAYIALKQLLSSRQETVKLVLSEGMGLGPFRLDTPALWDWVVHDVSLCLDLISASPIGVTAIGSSSANPHNSPEMVSISLQFPDDVTAWIASGNLSPLKQRRLSVFTNSHIYVVDDRSDVALSEADIDFSQRYTGGIVDGLALRPIPLEPRIEPMRNVLEYFVDHVSAGKQGNRFGLELAVETVEILSRCGELLGAPAANLRG